MSPGRARRLVTRLADVRRTDVALAGGKGANLGELMHAGFAVPDGFVVSTVAYASVLEAGGLARWITEGSAAGEDGASIRVALEGVAVPDPLQARIVEAYARIGGGPVAVRSSATAEDLPGAAFAGQQDTYLNVVGERAVLDAVRRCWGSLWTDRAIAYRRRLGIRSDQVAIAVVVQRMVEAGFAGVMFTANPVSGERAEVVIEAGSGLGEAVVSGLVTPDHYVVDADGSVRKPTSGRAEAVSRGRAGGDARHDGDGGVRLAHLPDSVPADLAVLGRSVAAHFGRPQDIEWAYAAGRIWLIQARPMTALPPPPLRLNRVQRWLGRQLMDYVTVRPYPLDMSAWILPGIGRMVERMLAEIPGLRVNLAEMFPESDGVVDRFVPPVPRPTRALLTAPARLPARVRWYDPATWTEDARFRQFRQAVRELAERDPSTLDWAELSRLPRRALAANDLVTSLRVDYLPRLGFDLLRLRSTLKLLGRVELFSLLILGARTRTQDANRALEDLAAQVRADPALRAAVTDLDPSTLLDRIEEDPRFAGLRAALGRFRVEYGHRETASPLLLSAPTWGENLTAVLGLVRVLVEERPTRPGPDRAAQAQQRLLDHRLVRLTRSGRVVRRIVDGARAGIAFREDTHFYATQVLPILRRALLETGGRLAAAGVLPDRDEVLHLRLEELEAIPDPVHLSGVDADRLCALARQRSARRAELAGVPLIATAVLFPAPDAGDVLISGVPASAGRATGPVRVIRKPEEFAAVRGGEVLVCPYTNPAWTPLFQRVAAVVADSGGPGSHAAIVAREYGIPAVMSTGTGTAVLTDGQLVTVDGDTGRVTGGDR